MRLFFDNFLFRTIGRFVFGIIWLFVLIILAAVLAAVLLLSFVSVLCLMWSAVNGFLYLVSHRHDIGQQALWFFLAGAGGFGVLMAIQGAIWDAFSAVRGRLSRPLALSASPRQISHRHARASRAGR